MTAPPSPPEQGGAQSAPAPAPKRGRGRPSKFDEQIAAELVQIVAAGTTLETAAAYVGINKDTLHEWLRTGARAKEGPLRDFSDRIKQAVAQAKVAMELTVRNASKGHWQAAAWWLERRYPKEYARREYVEQSNTTTVKLPAGMAKATTEQKIAAAHAQLRKARVRVIEEAPQEEQG